MSRKPRSAAPAATETPATSPVAKSVRGLPVRVLVTGVYGQCNTVAVLLPEAVDDAIKSGEVDSNPDAVAAVG